MYKPLISVIVPIYNVEQYISKCIESIINQTYKNIEIICVDDGSTDGSYEVIAKCAQADGRIKIIRKNNEGVSQARNSALDIASGDYIMFVDSDDWIDENCCEYSINIATSTGCDVVIWDYIREFENVSKPKHIFDSDKSFDESDVKRKLHRKLIGIIEDELKSPEKSDDLCTIWGKLYIRDCIYKNNIRFYDIHKIGTYEDGLFNLLVFENVRSAVYIRKYFYHYRKNNYHSITNSYNPNLVKQHERILEYMYKYICENKLGNEYIEALNNRTALELVVYGLNILKLRSGKIKALRKILNDSRYYNSYCNLKIQFMPIHWRIFYLLAKYKCTIGIYFLLVCMNAIRDK